MQHVGVNNVSGLILAGGRGERFGGVDKGWIEYRGRPLIAHAVERLKPQVRSILISANRSIERYAELGPVITDSDSGLDLEPFAGPLVGVLSGVRHAQTPYLAVVPCDVPHFPRNLVQRLSEAIGGATAAYARTDGLMQPAFALVRSSIADALAQSLLLGERTLHRWLASLDAVPVDFDDKQSFSNINTAADLDRATG
jgi:molybdenum cofactor guanylyltransferase